MKTFKSITLVALFLIASTFSSYANNTEPSNTKDALRAKIVTLIGDQIPVELTSKTVDAKVSFMINQKNEVVVVSVYSSNKNLDSYIKTKLNYKKVKVTGAKKGEVYTLPLRINKAS